MWTRRWRGIVKTLGEYTNNICPVVRGLEARTHSKPATFISTPQTVLSKACVAKATFKKKETVNWPGYGLLQLNLKH